MLMFCRYRGYLYFLRGYLPYLRGYLRGTRDGSPDKLIPGLLLDSEWFMVKSSPGDE